MKKNIIISNIGIKKLLFLVLSISIYSCEEFLEEVPPTFISTANFYKTQSDSRTACDGIYEMLHDGGWNSTYGRWWPAIDLGTDDVVSKVSRTNFNDWFSHTINPSHPWLESWSQYSNFWVGISRANSVIENVLIMPDDLFESIEYKNSIIGEARALRALYYFHLVKTYGDVPLIDKPITEKTDFAKPRVDVNTIYEQMIIPDLIFAEENCLDKLSDGHITKWNSKVILADVYLTRAGTRRTSQGEFVQGSADNWALARDKAEEIINQSPHQLITSPIVNGANTIPACGVAWNESQPFSVESMLELSSVNVELHGSILSRECGPYPHGAQYWGAVSNKPFANPTKPFEKFYENSSNTEIVTPTLTGGILEKNVSTPTMTGNTNSEVTKFTRNLSNPNSFMLFNLDEPITDISNYSLRLNAYIDKVESNFTNTNSRLVVILRNAVAGGTKQNTLIQNFTFGKKWTLFEFDFSGTTMPPEVINNGGYDQIFVFFTLGNGANDEITYYLDSIEQSFENAGSSILSTVAQMRFPGFPPAVGLYIPTPDLYASYEEGDERRDWNLMTKYITPEGNIYLSQPTFRKYVDIGYYLGNENTSFSNTNNNFILYRYADALLIYAEAANEVATATDGDGAYNAINEIRNRAGLEDLPAGLSQQQFREAVWKERRHEFAGECKRRFDLIRTNRLATETLNVKTTWTSAEGSLTTYKNVNTLFTGNVPWPDHEWLMPIPQSEIDLNTKNGWIQNNGY